MQANVLVIDDEDLFREDLASLLRQHGHQCRTASTGEEALRLVAEQDFRPDVVLCDVVLPGKGGVEVLDEILGICPDSAVIMITAYGSLETAVAAFRKGASDYIMKPLVVEDVLQKIGRLTEHRRLAREVALLRRQVSRDADAFPMVGQSEPMQRVFDLIAKVAPTRSTVLVSGESGTGKELVARTIHASGETPTRPFVAINCAALPAQLLESELFGHVRGAFTGADQDREGYFELAGEGTIFLDEISEMSVELQSKLLRVLEQREFTRVGQRRNIPLKARLLVSTNKVLSEQVAAGAFRQDLFFRVAVFEIVLPPLRDRRSDIPLLTEHFVSQFNRDMRRGCLGADAHAARMLLAHTWPGNVRELRNVIERAMILTTDDYITVAELPADIAGNQASRSYPDDLREAVRAYEQDHIRRALVASDGNKEEAARRLGINPSTLYRKMGDLGIGRKVNGEAQPPPFDRSADSPG